MRELMNFSTQSLLNTSRMSLRSGDLPFVECVNFLDRGFRLPTKLESRPFDLTCPTRKLIAQASAERFSPLPASRFDDATLIQSP